MKERLNEVYQDIIKSENESQHSKLMQQLFQGILSNIRDGG
jgi:hypothetical protein